LIPIRSSDYRAAKTGSRIEKNERVQNVAASGATVRQVWRTRSIIKKPITQKAGVRKLDIFYLPSEMVTSHSAALSAFGEHPREDIVGGKAFWKN